MKKLIVIVFSFGFSIPLLAAPTNLVLNPTFSEDLNNWGVAVIFMSGKKAGEEGKAQRPAKHPDFTFTIDPAVSRDEGGKSLRLTRTITDPDYYPGLVLFDSAVFAVKGGEEYEMSFWARTDNPDLTMVLFAAGDASGQHWYRRGELIVLTKEWRRYSLLITPPQDMKIYVRLDLFRGDRGDGVSDPKHARATGNIWIDEVECKVFEY